MCARYDLSSPPEFLIERFGLRVPPDGNLPRAPRAEIRPTDHAPVIDPSRTPHGLRWGLTVDWNKKPVINARSETLWEKPMFRTLLPYRAIVPADSWYEWQTDPSGRKTKMAVTIDRGLMGLAALVDPQAGRFVIITCPAAPAIAAIHHRMPVVLTDQAAEQAWLARGPMDREHFAPLLRTYDGDLQARPVPSEPPRPVAQGSLF